MSTTKLSQKMDVNQIIRNGGKIGQEGLLTHKMKKRSGTEVDTEIGGRYLLRYLHAGQLTEFLNGSERRHWVTPTPITPEDLVSWLALFEPTIKRKHVLILDPKKIKNICGPAYIHLGQGIEYCLPHGFGKEAIVSVGVVVID